MKLRTWVAVFDLDPFDVVRVKHPDIECDAPVHDLLDTRFADMECDEFVYMGKWPTLAGSKDRYRADVGW